MFSDMPTSARPTLSVSVLEAGSVLAGAQTGA